VKIRQVGIKLYQAINFIQVCDRRSLMDG
jgi:hypothetical protein